MHPAPTAPSPTPARPEPRREISRRWSIVIGVVWLAVVAVSAVWGLAEPEPTEREQTTVAQAQPYVDEAIARVADAASAGGAAVVAVSDFASVGACNVTVVRGGDRYRRTLVAVVPPGTELGTLERVAAGLPASYGAAVRGGSAPRLTADAGDYVLLGAAVTAPGEITFYADTGDCRPLGDLTPAGTEPAGPTDAITPLLTTLRLPDAAALHGFVSCVDSGALATAEVRTEPYAGDLGTELRDLPGITEVIVAEPALFAYRTADAQVAVRAHRDATVVTATTLCSAR